VTSAPQRRSDRAQTQRTTAARQSQRPETQTKQNQRRNKNNNNQFLCFTFGHVFVTTFASELNSPHMQPSPPITFFFCPSEAVKFRGSTK
jgi:hypothetical protein